MRPVRILAAVLLSVLGLPPSPAYAEQKAESPYFQVLGGDSPVEQLPLKSQKAEVTISGVIADVMLTQEFRNDGTVPIEAKYVFPGSTKAAVYDVTMVIGERRIKAKIKEKEEAKKTYEAAKAEGKTASLLEQHRPNVFQMNIANILPNDVIKVELRYTELVTPVNRQYQFVLPAVVGPRYSNGAEPASSGATGWISNPYLKEGIDAPYAWNVAVSIRSGISIKDVSSSSHQVTVDFENEKSAKVALATGIEATAGNRDFILSYRLAGGAVETGVLLYRGAEENFFIAQLEPPFEPQREDIPARDYVFILDVSGSMHGFPLDSAKVLLRSLFADLRPTDTFNVLMFSGGSAVLSETPLVASAENLNRAIQLIDDQTGGGGTELLPALQRALALPLPEDRSRSVVVVTDGYVSVEEQAFDLIRANLNRGNLFAFGVGTGVNRHLIEGMAHVGQGEPFFLTAPSQSTQVAEELRRYITSPLLSRAEVKFDGLDVYDVEPKSIPDVMASRPVTIVGKWRGEAKGTISLTGVTGKGRFERKLDLTSVTPSSDLQGLRYLWARTRIALLGDYEQLVSGDARRAEILKLGLRYSLLTKFTSFVAVDEVVRRNPADPLHSVKQPLPLPQGVSNLAVGGEIPTGPEPGEWALLGVLLLVALWGYGHSKRSLTQEI